MDGLIEWLRAQLDEDERLAKAATPGSWRVTERSRGISPCTEEGEVHTVELHKRWGTDPNPVPHQVITHGDRHEAVDRPDAEHIARHDPARVLREVEAKRRIVDEYAGAKRLIELTDGAAEDHQALRYRQFTVQVLAMPYRHRPGYRGEWRV